MPEKKPVKGILEDRKAVRYGAMQTDWQGRFEFDRLKRDRFNRAIAGLKAAGVGALIATLPENKRYISGCISGTSHGGAEESFALCFTTKPDISDVIVYEFGSTWLAEKEHITWIKPENYRPYSSVWFHSKGQAHIAWHAKETVAQFKRDLQAAGVAKEKVAVDGMTAAFREAMKEAGINVVDGFYLMHEIRSTKTDLEIECMKMAGAVADIGFGAVVEALRPGVRDSDVSAAGVNAMMTSSYLWTMPMIVSVRSGTETCPNYIVRMPTDRIIQPGDMVYNDIVIGWNGYRTCYYRTYKVGPKPTQKEKDWYKKTREILYDGVLAIRDGVTTADVASKWPKYSEWKIPNEACAVGNAMGHGMGLTNYDVPFIARDNSMKFPQPIKENMCLAMETWWGEDDIANKWRGGCRIENVYLVTKRGSQNLYAMPDEGIICPPHGCWDIAI